ncbi:MAG: formylglycine-generating enzyme family protein, partial [bacterium]|nr:formylglycine-generating enzyme family protein [bacterium]
MSILRTTNSIFLCVILILAAAYPVFAQSSVNDGYGDYVRVPIGRSFIGDNFDEGDPDEVPVHEVFLEDYFIGKYKVTNAEYKKFVDDRGYGNSSYWTAGGFGEYGDKPRFWDNERFKGGGLEGNDNFPVVGVSWFEAMAYSAWLSDKTGEVYRLPTEAEWEKAARGLDGRRFSWGADITGYYANLEFSNDPFERGLTPVGYYDGSRHGEYNTNSNMSPCGAYDMVGNVWEWCLDWYASGYYSVSPENDPKGPETGSSRVLRAGGWVDGEYYMRCANRNSSFPENRNPIQGFRCVR